MELSFPWSDFSPLLLGPIAAARPTAPAAAARQSRRHDRRRCGAGEDSLPSILV